MESDTVAQTEEQQGSEVMAAVESGPRDEFVLADITTDNAYITMPLDEAASLPAWR
ncbi:MAG: DUF7556 family protein [Halovenus sp.]